MAWVQELRGQGAWAGVVAALPVVELLPAAVRQLVPSVLVLPQLVVIQLLSVVKLPLLLLGPVVLALLKTWVRR